MSQTYTNPLRRWCAALSCLLLLGLALPSLAQTADLSLALSQDVPSPKRYTSYQVTATVTNAGPDAATGVQVSIPRPSRAITYVGGNEFSATQGSFTPKAGDVWTVGTLASGASASITLNIYLRGAGGAPDYYGQVVASGASDPDSSPANGAPGTVNEDDEASTELGTGGSTGGSNGVDLTLAITQPSSIDRYIIYETTVTVTNEGDAPATGVVVRAPRAAGVVYQGGNEATASQGTFVTGGSARGTWRVGRLAAGASATISIRNFLLEPVASASYAEVTALNEQDVDSTPGNGTAPTVNEDDEASTEFGTGGGGTTPPGGGDLDPCNPPMAAPDDIVRVSSAAGGIVTVVYRTNAGGVDSFSIDGPAAVGVDIVDPNVFLAQSAARSATSGEFVITGTFRQNGNPANAQPYIIRTNSSGAVINGFVPNITISDLLGFEFIDFGGSGLSDIFYVGALSTFRSFSVIGINRTGAFLEGGQVGDLTSNRVGGNVVATDGNIIQSRRLTLQIWPRIRKISGTGNGQQLWEVELGRLVFPNPAGTVTGDVGSPIALSDGGAMVAFSALNNSVGGQYITRVDASGNELFTVEVPFNRQTDNLFSAVFADAQDNVVFVAEPRFPATEPTTIIVSATGQVLTCTNSGGPAIGVDLEASIDAPVQRPRRNTFNTVTISVTNAGDAPASGVSVRVPRAIGATANSVVFQGGNEFTASQGNYSPYGSRVWTVGNVAPGQTVTLALNYYVRREGGYIQTADVLTQNEVDADSTPGNGDASEDDYGFADRTYPTSLPLTLAPSGATVGATVIARLEAVPTAQRTELVVVNMSGQVVYRLPVELIEGDNAIELTTNSLSPGIYFVAAIGIDVVPAKLLVR